MLVVVALGGNALLRRGEPTDANAQRHNVQAAACVLARIATDHQLVITHGIGPQIGMLALQSEAYGDVCSYPLDVLGAESEGMIGYLIEQGIRNAIPGRETASLLAQVLVDADDPGFSMPDKPVGRAYARDEAERLQRERGWTLAPDGQNWRRVVASPKPLRILELAAIRALVAQDIIVTCVGGGGVPVIRQQDGNLRGVEGVIDEDLSAAMLARELGADALLLLTDVPGIQLDFGTDHARTLAEITPFRLRRIPLAAGSIRPKALAAADFVEQHGGLAAIGLLEEAAGMLAGVAGTQVRWRCDRRPHQRAAATVEGGSPGCAAASSDVTSAHTAVGPDRDGSWQGTV